MIVFSISVIYAIDLSARPFMIPIHPMNIARVEVCFQPVKASTAYAKLIPMHSDDASVKYLVSSFELIVPTMVQTFTCVFVAQISRYVAIFGCHVDSASRMWGISGSSSVVVLLSTMQGKVRGTNDAQQQRPGNSFLVAEAMLCSSGVIYTIARTWASIS
jgi:hypothetical protein